MVKESAPVVKKSAPVGYCSTGFGSCSAEVGSCSPNPPMDMQILDGDYINFPTEIHQISKTHTVLRISDLKRVSKEYLCDLRI